GSYISTPSLHPPKFFDPRTVLTGSANDGGKPVEPAGSTKERADVIRPGRLNRESLLNSRKTTPNPPTKAEKPVFFSPYSALGSRGKRAKQPENEGFSARDQVFFAE
ncbi:MAG: hypothetical protein J6S27_05780, partial [Thermoguttaceae bacterium]|nr:hypothetical protein [Thermoguttaceae bacterium]